MIKIKDSEIEKITTLFDGSYIDVARFFCLGPLKNPDEDYLYNTDLSKIFSDPVAEIAEDTLTQFTNTKSCKCFIPERWVDEFSRQYLTQDPEERFYLFSNIRTSDEIDVIVNLGIGFEERLWVNEEFITRGVLYPDSFACLHLNKGDSLFIIECKCLNTAPRLGLRINNYHDKMFGINSDVASHLQSTFLTDTCISFAQDVLDPDGKFEFMVTPKDAINSKPGDPITVTVKNETGMVLDQFEASSCRKISYDLRCARAKQRDCTFLTFVVTVRLRSGTIVNMKKAVTLLDVEKELDILNQKYTSLRSQLMLNDLDEINIQRRFHNIRRLLMNDYVPELTKDDDWMTKSVIAEEMELLSILDGIAKKEHFVDFTRRSGTTSFYFKSNLDNRAEMFSVCLPDSYSEVKKYPLIIFLPVVSPYAPLDYLKSILEEDVILADITLRGYTTGSYIGEAAFLEAYNTILRTYSIDEDRVYLTGFSNGGYGIWNLAQAHPSLFAAIVPVGGGTYSPNSVNLCNTKVFNIRAGEDRPEIVDAARAVKEILEPYGNFKELVPSRAIHNSLWIAMYSKSNLHWMLDQTRHEFPYRIHFRTERIRHNKTQWIEIGQIQHGKRYCEVHGEIVGRSCLSVNTENVDVFKVEVPPFMDRDNLSLVINHSDPFDISSADVNIYCRNENGKILVSSEPPKEWQNGSQGMGILDIYMDCLKVVIPSQFDNDEIESSINKVAKNLSNPTTLGEIPNIRYYCPICEAEEQDDSRFADTNLLLVGAGNNLGMLTTYRGRLPVHIEKGGYYYDSTYHKGSYCIMFITSNPNNPKRKMLVIYANDHVLFEKNIFTRRLIIPSYVNGFHPFLNSELLVFDGGQYFSSLTIGEELVPIGSAPK